MPRHPRPSLKLPPEFNSPRPERCAPETQEIETPVLSNVSEAHALEAAASLRARWESLTYRQQQIALLVLREKLTNNQIAHRLSLSPHTIKSHLSAVYARLGVENRLQFRLGMRFIELLDEHLEDHPAPAREEKTPPAAA